MPSPESKVSRLARLLRTSPTIQGWCEVLVGKRSLSTRGGPRRVALVPSDGVIRMPRVSDQAIRDVDRKIVMHLWAADVDELEELQQRIFQGLEYQAAGGPSNSPNAVAGLFWEAFEESWDTSPDANMDGEEMEITLVVPMSVDRTPPQLGLVQSIAFSTLSTTLTAPAGLADQTLSVFSTAGFPPQGLVTIDAEQVGYLIATPTSLTALTRGANGTTPATHLQGATVAPVSHP